MFDFRMSVRENFASFRDDSTGQVVFVDSLDNQTFNVRKGTLSDSQHLGAITADSDEVLNLKLRDLVSGTSGS
jgi:hypothetical protein